MSVGMNTLFNLVGKVASMLGDDYDIEIVEQHHRFKKDAPSGSALTLAENIAKATGKKFPDCLTFGRSGKDALREKGKIGIHAVRAGDIVGIHSVIFSTLGRDDNFESHRSQQGHLCPRRNSCRRLAHRQKTRPLLNGRRIRT